MGYSFQAKHANLVSFLVHRNAKPPRSTRREVEEFLFSLAMPRSDLREAFISGLDGSWQRQIREVSHQILGDLEVFPDTPLPNSSVAAKLRPLAKYFSYFSLFSLVLVGDEDEDGDQFATAFFREAAIASGEHGLFLKPEGFSGNLSFLDPFPSITAFSATPAEYPSVAFWTPTGQAVVLKLEDGAHFYWERLQPILDGSKNILQSLAVEISKKRNERKGRTILHLSDLHLGAPSVAAKRQYLKASLRSVSERADRVVLTGDLFDNPNSELRTQFDEFRTDLEIFTKDNIIIIPGNHDVRFNGNKFGGYGESYKAFSNLWQPIVVDDEMKAVFLCFDSCEEGSFARGRVSAEQRLAVAGQLEALTNKNSDLLEYTKIALVHHHPLPFDSEPEATAFYQRVIQAVFPPDKFLAFENAGEFNVWCEKRDVSLILHGHKHAPRQTWTDEGILVVGCGSTTGVANAPMCYDLVTLDPDSQAWSVSFFHDEHADGGGFQLQSVSLSAPRNH